MNIVQNSTLGIVSRNISALNLCLTSVLSGTEAPATIVVLLTGEILHLNDFYLEQLSTLARFHDIECVFVVNKITGIRDARDYLLDYCKSEYLWMLDDDVVVDFDCFRRLLLAMTKTKKRFVYMNATKGDVTNRRGYVNFESKEMPYVSAKEGSSFNHFYQKPPIELLEKGILPICFEVGTLDTGNVLIRMMYENELTFSTRFSVFPDSINSGGEDTLFALCLRKEGLVGAFCPSARSYHLEKEGASFNEFAARGEMIARACDVLGLDKSFLHHEMMRWLWSDAEKVPKYGNKAKRRKI